MHAGESGKFRMYNWAFHVSHGERHIVWDLGLDEVGWSLVFLPIIRFTDSVLTGSKLLHAMG